MNVLSDGNVRARKKHVCDWCSETIKQGEVYWSCSYADGGEITTTRLHTECHAAMNRELGASGEQEIYLTGDFPRGLTDWEASEMGEVPKCS